MLNCAWGKLFTCQEISALKSPAAADEGILYGGRAQKLNGMR